MGGVKVDFNIKALGCTPAYVAALDGHSEVIEALADGGADLDILSGVESSTPAHAAARFGKLEALKTLGRKGAKLNEENDLGFTPAMIAIVAEQKSKEQKDTFKDIFKYLTEHAKVDVTRIREIMERAAEFLDEPRGVVSAPQVAPASRADRSSRQ